MRRSAAGKRRDANEGPIVDALRAAGATVLQLSEPNAPDLLVGFRGINYLLEVKMPKGRLSEGQGNWWQEWAGNVYLVREPEQALQLLGIQARRTG